MRTDQNLEETGKPFDALPVLQGWWKMGIAVALAAGLYLRLVGLSYPPFDAHSFRQTQTLSTIEDFYLHGTDVLHPKAIYMGYPGTFVLEFPIFQATVASLYRLFGPHIEIIRILNIAFGIGTTWLLFRIAKTFLNFETSTIAALIYWLAPLNIIYQRSMLIDSAAVFFALLSFGQMARLLFPSVSGLGAVRGSRTFTWLILVLGVFVTVMVKALYLWPLVLLFGFHVIARKFRPNPTIIGITSVLALAGVCFLIWNAYAGRVNDQSIFAKGTDPTGHLGISKLLEVDFYKMMLLQRPKRWLGMIAILAFPVGLLAVWFCPMVRREKLAAIFAAIVPPGYLLVFANINFPHEYYQLIITPFLAVVSAVGVWYLIRRFGKNTGLQLVMFMTACFVLSAVAIWTYLYWMKAPQLGKAVISFENLCRGRFEHNSQAMVFISAEGADLDPDSYIPQYIYAAGAWGYGRAVTNQLSAENYYRQLSPAMPGLKHLIFCGLPEPTWLPVGLFSQQVCDDTNRYYVYTRLEVR